VSERRSAARQRGLAVTELALVTPVLLVTMLIAAEFTRVFYEYNTLTKSVRDAARFLAEDAYDGAGVYEIDSTTIERATNLAVTGELVGGTPLLDGLSATDIEIDTNGAHKGAAPLVREHVQVTGSYEFQPLAPVIAGIGFLPADVGMNFTLVASSTMRAL